MTRATRTAEYTGATTLCLYLAFELGSNEWKLGFTTAPGATPRVRTMPARDLERLTREIADARQWFGLKAATPVRSCYEAGRDGFWLHRYLTSLGITNVVVDSSSIEVNRQGPAAAPPARSRADRCVGLCERVLRVATVPEPQGGRGGGGAHADAVPEWRRAPGTRDQPGGESAHSGGRQRDGLGLVAVSAAEPPEPMVSGAVRPRRSTSPQGGDCRPRPEVVDRAVALPRVRRGAGGRTAEDGVKGFPVGSGVTLE